MVSQALWLHFTFKICEQNTGPHGHYCTVQCSFSKLTTHRNEVQLSIRRVGSLIKLTLSTVRIRRNHHTEHLRWSEYGDGSVKKVWYKVAI